MSRPVFHVRRGDKIRILAGEFKGQEGVILKMFTKKSRAAIEGEGIRPLKRHTKPNAKYPEGGIIDLPRTFHVSNLMVIDKETGEPTRTKRIKIDGKRTRVSVKTNKPV